MQEVLNSSVNMNWQTPNDFLELVRQVNAIALDPCTTYKNPCNASRFCAPLVFDIEGANTTSGMSFTIPPKLHNCISHNGLDEDWYELSKDRGLVYSNPPYGRSTGQWTAKAVKEANRGSEIIMLLAARTDSRWAQHAIPESDAALFWKGRIRFNDTNGQPAMVFSKKFQKWVPAKAAFPSMVLYFGPNVERFEEVFGSKGILY